MEAVRRLAVIGGGSWGSALAVIAARAGAQVKLWARNPVTVHGVNLYRENGFYLSGIVFPDAIFATVDMAEALEDAEAALIVVPAQSLRQVLGALKTHLPPDVPLLLCAKGIENGSLKTMTEVAAELLPDSPVAVLSGPSFAAEAAAGLPTAVTIASRDLSLAQAFVETLADGRFRPYSSEDVVGVEIGGAVKNVMAIACGIVEGRELGENARAALITRGLAEMVRLGVAKGAEPETFRGLSGLGDLVLTCTTRQSRNYALGVGLGCGGTLEQALKTQLTVVEGVATSAAVTRLAARLHVEMPITAAVDAVLHRGMAIDAMVEALLSRPYRSE